MAQEQRMSAEEVRVGWRQVQEDTIAGKTTIVERYGEERLAILPISEYREYLRLKEQANERAT